MSTCQLVNLCSKARILGHAMQKLPKRVLEFQGHQAAYDLTPTLGVALCCPFLSQLAHCCLLLTRSDDCLFPGAWNGGAGNAAGPRASLNPARKSKKRLNGRSCPAAAEDEPFVGRRQISLAASHKPRSCWRGRCAEERQPLDVVVGEREKMCSRLMLFRYARRYES